MMRDTIDTREALQMMARCKEEIQSLRAQINHLKPKADAYDNLAIVLNLLPRQSMGAGEDLIWVLDKRMRELKEASSSEVPDTPWCADESNLTSREARQLR